MHFKFVMLADLVKDSPEYI